MKRRYCFDFETSLLPLLVSHFNISFNYYVGNDNDGDDDDNDNDDDDDDIVVVVGGGDDDDYVMILR